MFGKYRRRTLWGLYLVRKTEMTPDLQPNSSWRQSGPATQHVTCTQSATQHVTCTQSGPVTQHVTCTQSGPATQHVTCTQSGPATQHVTCIHATAQTLHSLSSYTQANHRQHKGPLASPTIKVEYCLNLYLSAHCIKCNAPLTHTFNFHWNMLTPYKAPQNWWYS